jgi:hypothetical protein
MYELFVHLRSSDPHSSRIFSRLSEMQAEHDFYTSIQCEADWNDQTDPE